jgi:RNA polymerase sigma-70 factor (ECF subfamily)
MFGPGRANPDTLWLLCAARAAAAPLRNHLLRPRHTATNTVSTTPHRAPEDDLQDLAWLRATAAGDRAAFERLYCSHQPRLMRFLWRHVSRPELAEEIVNDALWVVWRQAGSFRGEAKVRTWITGITYRCMLRALRDGPPADEVSESLLMDFDLDALPGSADDEERRELRDWLAQGLKTLPAEQRMTLELAYLLGESCEEIAAIMGCAVGTVKARMFHARVRLRNVLPGLGGMAAATPVQQLRKE